MITQGFNLAFFFFFKRLLYYPFLSPKLSPALLPLLLPPTSNSPNLAVLTLSFLYDPPLAFPLSDH